ncbi:MAG TPA: hypothetical protein VLA12_18200 [Planctomycetaceae bacterium]|nr:hypothetical protein [Planctomycetaceae bacterium]
MQPALSSPGTILEQREAKVCRTHLVIARKNVLNRSDRRRFYAMRVTTPDPRGYPYPAVEKGDWLGAGSDDSRGILVVATCLSPFSTRCFPPHDCMG